MQDIIEHNNSLKTQLEATQDSLRNAEHKKIELHRMNNSLRDEKAQLLEREGVMKREAAAKEREAQQKAADLLAKTRKQEEEIRQLKERLRQAEEKNSHTTNLLQVRTADLRGAEAFLTTADQYSGADIVNMVKSLNAEIFQAAAFMAELLEDPAMVATEEDRKRNLQKYVRSIEVARSEIGDSLFAYFLDKGTRVRSDPLPLQLALQSLFSRWSAIKTQRFCDNEGLDRNLQSLYQEIQGSGKPLWINSISTNNIRLQSHKQWQEDGVQSPTPG
jgi:DNA repair exonuclease SbcCD ATPase subunit